MGKLGDTQTEAAIGKYFQLAMRLARKKKQKLPSGIDELDDLIGVASLGLVNSVHAYDPDKGIPLSQWVEWRVRNAINDYLRTLDLLPQERRERVKLVRDVQAYMETQLHRRPTAAEIAEFIESDEQIVNAILQDRALTLVSTEDEGVPELSDEHVGRADKDMEHVFEQRQRRLHLGECIAALGTEEGREAIRMHLAGATLEEIATFQQKSTAAAHRRVRSAVAAITRCMQEKGWKSEEDESQ